MSPMSIAEIDKARETSQAHIQKEMRGKSAQEEPWTTKSMASFEVLRYVTGQAVGLYTVIQTKPVRKRLVEGVLMDGVEDAIRRALGAALNRKSK